MRFDFKSNGGIIDFFFPRKKKIRFEAESTIWVTPQGGRVDYEFGTFRAFFWHYFHTFVTLPIRESLIQVRLHPQCGAIAYDTSTNSGDKSNATPWEWSHTSTGSDLTMVASIQWWDNSDTITINTPTYNGVNMTSSQEVKENNVYVNRAATWYLANPATGLNTVSVSFSAGSYGMAGTATFSGTNTSSPVDTSNKAFGNSTAPSVSVTTNNANSFLVDCMSCVDNAAGTSTAGSGQTINVGWGSTRGGEASRKSTTSAGSQTMSWSLSVGGRWAHVIIAINEKAAVAAAGGTLLTLMTG